MMYVFSTKKILFLFFLLFIFSLSLNAKNLVISGNYKLSLDDIQFLSNIDIKSSSLNINDINSLLIDLKNSELINDVSFEEQVNFYSISITEEKFIENIFINGNIFSNLCRIYKINSFLNH